MPFAVPHVVRHALIPVLAAFAVISPISAHAASSGHHARSLHDIAAHPDYYLACTRHGPNNPTCIKQELAAINYARAHEPGKPRRMVLPRNYRKLSPVRQTFVVTNLERVDRGLAPIKGLTPALNRRAQLGAKAHADPILPVWLMELLHLRAWGSIWAGDLGPLAADYDWMYNDGYSASSPNLECTSRSAPGCWGHRGNILGSYEGLPLLTAGVGATRAAWFSIAEVISGGTGKTPRLTYTWKQALAHGANR